MKFTQLALNEHIQKTLQQKGYVEPTPIQAQAIPVILEGKDVLGIAQTGTGKTAAFGLPILQQLSERKKPVQKNHARALILAPTRELAAQIDKSLQEYAHRLNLTHACVFGGVNQKPQERAMAKGVDVLVATPGRLLDLYRQKYVSFHSVEYFVLDEADRMLDMGFLPDMKTIIKELRSVKQRLLFSATMAKEIEKLAQELLKNPVKIEIAPESTTVEKIDQHVLFVDPDNKNPLLLHLLGKDELDHVLIFTRTKHRSDRIARLLNKKKIKADAIHGDKSQNARTRALESFRRKKTQVLVATEIAARGLDVDDISHVINFDVPEDPESYVHRIGRTARAGSEGVAYLFCTAQEIALLRNIEKSIDMKLHVEEHPYHSVQAENSKIPYKGRSSRGSKGKRKSSGGRRRGSHPGRSSNRRRRKQN